MWPVLLRELETESRHAFTYWLRVLGAGAMLLVGWYALVNSGLAANQGEQLFPRLHLTLFVSIWLFVPLVSADCISRERREGTLGLLFLTPLNAREVVLAKALAHGLRAMTLCLSVLPVLMIPFLMGGVAWQEAVLSLETNLSSFFCALAVGLLASSLTRAWLRALWTAMGLGVVAGICFSLLNGFVLTSALIPYTPSASLRSIPWEEFVEDAVLLATNAGGIWKQMFSMIRKPGQAAVLWGGASMGVISLIGLLVVLQLAASRVRRHWRDQPASLRRLWWERTFFTPIMGVNFYRGWMRWKLNRNPIGWLEQRTWSGRLMMWSWFAITFCLDALAAPITDFSGDAFNAVQSLLASMLAASLALSASGSFRRERETGVLELLLVSPLSGGQIISGRLRGLWGQFLPASLVLFGVWLFFRPVMRNVNSGNWIWSHGSAFLFFYGSTFLTLPVIGLYCSLQRTHFIGAFVWTLLLGLALPLFFVALDQVVTGLEDPSRELMIAVAMQISIAAFMGFNLYRCLASRTFNFQRGDR